MTRSSQIAKRCPDVSIFQQVSVVNLEVVWESKKRMQAEGGFGSRQIFVGCFASAIEFGPQRLTNINTTRPA
jgi:hypothetical protein